MYRHGSGTGRPRSSQYFHKTGPRADRPSETLAGKGIFAPTSVTYDQANPFLPCAPETAQAASGIELLHSFRSIH
jgi:hypothetical protein